MASFRFGESRPAVDGSLRGNASSDTLSGRVRWRTLFEESPTTSPGRAEVNVLKVDVGQIIAGKYELVRLLGKGAMGEVWLAIHNTLGGEVAIKLVEPADDVEAETAAGRFQLEAQIAAKLSRRTRHIVSVSDHGEEDGLAYLVMEKLDGESLDQRTARGGPLTIPEVAAIVTQVARALSLAHEEGIFHRDLKPPNLWLGRDEDGRLLVKLLDFGIARSKKPFRTRSPFTTSKDMVLGTPSYMSPEQARGLDSLDHRCDVWALAVVAYEALTEKLPFDGETLEDVFLSICTFRVVPIRSRRPTLPPAIDAIFARAFASNLDERFRTALEFSEAFEQLVTPEELDAALGFPSLRRRSDPSLAAAAAPARQSRPDITGPIGGGESPSSTESMSRIEARRDAATLSTPATPSSVKMTTPLSRPVSRPSYPEVTTPGQTHPLPPDPNGPSSYSNLAAPPSSNHPMYVVRASYPSLETGTGIDPSMNVSVGASSRRSSGIVPFLIAAVVLVLASVLGIFVFTTRGPKTVSTPTTASSSRVAVAPTPALPPGTATPEPTPPPPPSTASPNEKASSPKVAVVPPKSTQQRPAASPAPPRPTPGHPPSPTASTPQPAPAKSINKADVF